MYNQAFMANSYFLIVKQYNEFKPHYYTEMNVSPAFYGLICSALTKACFMDVAQLFERGKGSVNIGSLLEYCTSNGALFSNDKYEYQLKTEEECYYRDLVKAMRSNYKRIGIISYETQPVTVEISLLEHIELYKKRLHSLNKTVKNIGEQRNKIYAHDLLFQKYFVSYQDLKTLIDFALDCICLVIGSLSGVSKSREAIEIDDWCKTLNLVKIGLECRNKKIKKILNKE